MGSETAEQAKPENQDKTKAQFGLSDIIKSLGVLAVVIPLILGYMEYKQAVQENQNKNFREIVSGLSSDAKQNRLASASNLGTFIKEGNPYYNEAVDILINMVAIESEIDVLQAIRSSLEQTSPEDHKMVIQKLLKLGRNSFIYKEYLEEKQKSDQRTTKNEFLKYQNLLKDIEEKSLQSKQKAVQMELEAYKQRYLESMKRQKESELIYSEQPFRKERTAKFILSFLSFARKTPLKGLELYQNSWNYVVLADLKLPEISIIRSAVSSATIANVDFNHAKIENSTFFLSGLSNTDFSGSTIKATLFDQLKSLKNVSFKDVSFEDVFFTGSDLKGADFSSAKGLKPVYFYKAINLDQAKFDAEFAKQLEGIKEKISDTDFRDYVRKSSLSRFKQREIFKTLDEIK